MSRNQANTSSNADSAPRLITPSELAARLNIRPAAKNEDERGPRLGILQRIEAVHPRRDSPHTGGSEQQAASRARDGGGDAPERRFYHPLARAPRAPTMRPPIPTYARRSRLEEQRPTDDGDSDIGSSDVTMRIQGDRGARPPLMPRAQRILYHLRRQQQLYQAGQDARPAHPNPVGSSVSHASLRVRVDHSLYWNSTDTRGLTSGYALLAVGTVLGEDNSSTTTASNPTPALILVSTVSRPSNEPTPHRDDRSDQGAIVRAPSEGTVISLPSAFTLPSTAPTQGSKSSASGRPQHMLVFAPCFSGRL
ncbi:unnamed protein product [Tilletia controversa]|nr:unnamed protein product [Tilletia controversa]